jgi:hypothetical protein
VRKNQDSLNESPTLGRVSPARNLKEELVKNVEMGATLIFTMRKRDAGGDSILVHGISASFEAKIGYTCSLCEALIC